MVITYFRICVLCRGVLVEEQCVGAGFAGGGRRRRKMMDAFQQKSNTYSGAHESLDNRLIFTVLSALNSVPKTVFKGTNKSPFLILKIKVHHHNWTEKKIWCSIFKYIVMECTAMYPSLLSAIYLPSFACYELSVEEKVNTHPRWSWWDEKGTEIYLYHKMSCSPSLS